MRQAVVVPLVMLLNLIGGFIALVIRLSTGRSDLAYAWVKRWLRLFLYLTGVRVRTVKVSGGKIESGSVLISNFIGVETLPAYLVALPGQIALPIRWFNFLIPILGWTMWAIDQVPVPRGRPKLFQQRIQRVLSKGCVYVHFPSPSQSEADTASPMLRRWAESGVAIRMLTVSRVLVADGFYGEELVFEVSEPIELGKGAVGRVGQRMAGSAVELS